MTDELPLPKGMKIGTKLGTSSVIHSTELRKGECVFTADQTRAYGKACAAAEREACAKIADDMDFGPGEIAAAIRGRSNDR